MTQWSLKALRIWHQSNREENEKLRQFYHFVIQMVHFFRHIVLFKKKKHKIWIFSWNVTWAKIYLSTKSIYVNSDTFCDCLKNHFTLRKPIVKVLFFLDGHSLPWNVRVCWTKRNSSILSNVSYHSLVATSWLFFFQVPNKANLLCFVL